MMIGGKRCYSGRRAVGRIWPIISSIWWTEWVKSIVEWITAAVTSLPWQRTSATSETTALKQIDCFNYLIFTVNETCLLGIYRWLAMANGNCEYTQFSAGWLTGSSELQSNSVISWHEQRQDKHLGQNKQTLFFSLIALSCLSLYLFISEQWLEILIWRSGPFVPQWMTKDNNCFSGSSVKIVKNKQIRVTFASVTA